MVLQYERPSCSDNAVITKKGFLQIASFRNGTHIHNSETAHFIFCGADGTIMVARQIGRMPGNRPGARLARDAVNATREVP